MLGPIPDPLPNTWIAVERDEADCWHLRWLPFPERKVNWARWRDLAGTFLVIPFWALGLFLIGGLWLLVVLHILEGPPPALVWALFVILTVFLVPVLLFGLALAKTFWCLLCPPRPERLTLAPDGLTHDPGRFSFRGFDNFFRQPRDVPREGLGDIRLERVEGRQRLTIDRGVERIEVGACLREPEREWLAEVLRAWAGRPGAEDFRASPPALRDNWPAPAERKGATPVSAPGLPPPGSWVQVGRDGQGRPRLTWQEPLTRQAYLVRCALGCGFAGLLGYFAVPPAIRHVLGMWAEALARAPAGHPWQVRAFLIFLNVFGFFVLTLLTAAAVGLALYCCWLVYVSLRPRGPEHLSAGPEGLRYEFEGPLRLRRQVREVPWDELGEVRIEQPMGREALTVGRGAERLEIGRHLRKPDRAWLAGALRAWAAEMGSPAPAPGLGPPRGSAIWAEHGGEGCLVLRWKGLRRGEGRACWDCLGGELVKLLTGAFCMGLVLFLIVIPILTGLWGCWGIVVKSVSLAIGFGFVGTWAVAWGVMLRRFWRLLRGPTSACLTLTPAALRYDPGRYFDGKDVLRGVPCDAPLAELGTVRLEGTEKGQRLTVDHGAERFEIGPTLEGSEREWLAALLRAWAGREELSAAGTAGAAYSG